jgi:hypothetical protein
VKEVIIMAVKKRTKRFKKHFSVAQANASLPLIRAIVRDITELAREVQERHDRVACLLPGDGPAIGEAHREEVQQIQEQMERDQERMREYVEELQNLGVELKDYHTGLVDFPHWMDGREVLLCWRLGEPEVAHWHELDAGFAGRQKLMVDA